MIRPKLSLQQCFSISVAQQTVSHPILRHTDLEDLVFCNRAALFPCRYGKEAWIIDDYYQSFLHCDIFLKKIYSLEALSLTELLLQISFLTISGYILLAYSVCK
jgi:hypothetical protein